MSQQQLDKTFHLTEMWRRLVYLASLFLGALFSYSYFNNDSFVLHLLVSFLAGLLVYIPIRGMIMSIVVQHVYKGDIDAMKQDIKILESMEAEEKTKSSHTEVSLVILGHSEQIAGRFKDTDYYQHLVIKMPNDKVMKYEFLGTVDLDSGNTVELKNDELLLQPGLLYRAVEQVN